MYTQKSTLCFYLLFSFLAVFSSEGYARTIPVTTLSTQVKESDAAYEALILSGQCIQEKCGNSIKSYKIICLSVIFGACGKGDQMITRDRLEIGEKYILLSKVSSKSKQTYYSAFQIIEYGKSSKSYRVKNNSYFIIDNIIQHENRDDGPIYSYFSYVEFKNYLLRNKNL